MGAYTKKAARVISVILLLSLGVNMSWGDGLDTGKSPNTKKSWVSSALSWRPWGRKDPSVANSLPQGDHYLLGQYGAKSDSEILRDLQNKADRTYRDFIDQGTLLALQGDYLRASDSFEMAARKAGNEKELSGALFNKAGAQAYCSLDDARKTIDVAARIQPRNYEIVKLRFALNELSGNALGTIAAQDQLLRIDPSMAGHEVAFPVLGYVAVTAILAVTARELIVYKLLPPEDRLEYVKVSSHDYYRVIGTIVSPGTTGATTLADYMRKNKA